MNKTEIQAAATEIAMQVAQNAGVAPNLCFPHIFLGIMNIFAKVEAGNPASVATPAAASAGAAGTIDAPEFRKSLSDYFYATTLNIDARFASHVAHIDQHTAEVVAEAVAEAREEERNRAIGIMAHRDQVLAERAREEGRQAGIQQERALCELSAEGQAIEGGAMISYAAALAAVTMMRGCAATYVEDHGKDTYPGEIGLRPQDVATMWAKEIHGIDAKAFLDDAVVDLAATAPVSAAPTADDGVDVFEETYRQEYEYKEGEEIRDYGHHDTAMRWFNIGRASNPQSAGAPVSAAEPSGSLTNEGTIAPADGQELPAPPPGWEVRRDDDGVIVVMKAGVGGVVLDETYQRENIAASIFAAFLGDVLAMRQPDPAGEWVKRADLAMGQALGEVLPEPGADITPAMQAAARKYEHDCADYMIHTTPKGYWKALYGAAKQAGKESK